MNPPINLIHLKFFYDAVIYQSISEAAKVNFISQSAVSQAITKLESIFGVELLTQNRQRLQPTEEGQIVLEQARQIFRLVRETFDKVKSSKSKIAGSIKFVTTKSLGMSFLAPTYQHLKQNFPDLEFSFKMGGLNFIRNALKNEEVEFAIVIYERNFDQFDKYHLQSGHFRLYKSHEMPNDKIENGVFVDDYEGPFVNNLTDILTKNNIQNPIQDLLAGWEIIARFIELEIGVGFIPDYILTNNRYPNIEPHPLKIPKFEYEICAIFNKGTKLSRSALLFLEQFKLG